MFYIKTLKHHIQDVSVLLIMLLGKLYDFLGFKYLQAFE